MKLSLSPDRLTICQLAADASIPAWISGQCSFCSITRTSEEFSIVCPEGLVPKDVKQEAGWRALKVEGPLDFTLTGVLASVATPLAKAGVSIFTISTFNTDYVLVKDNQIAAAVKALYAAGHAVKVD